MQWNQAYGLSTVLLRNFVMGVFMAMTVAIVWLAIQLSECNNKRVLETKDYDNMLMSEIRRQDSVNFIFTLKYRELKFEEDAKK